MDAGDRAGQPSRTPVRGHRILPGAALPTWTKKRRSAASFRLALARWQVTSTTCPRNGARPPYGRGTVLELYLNGKLVAKSLDAPDRPLDVTTVSPLRIGLGGLTYFAGASTCVFIEALSELEIAALAR